jgi:hypothetical protein
LNGISGFLTPKQWHQKHCLPDGQTEKGLNPDSGIKPFFFIGAPRVIRTPDLRIRSPLRYPAALWARKKQWHKAQLILITHSELSGNSGFNNFCNNQEWILRIFSIRSVVEKPASKGILFTSPPAAFTTSDPIISSSAQSPPFTRI